MDRQIGNLEAIAAYNNYALNILQLWSDKNGRHKNKNI